MNFITTDVVASVSINKILTDERAQYDALLQTGSGSRIFGDK